MLNIYSTGSDSTTLNFALPKYIICVYDVISDEWRHIPSLQRKMIQFLDFHEKENGRRRRSNKVYKIACDFNL